VRRQSGPGAGPPRCGPRPAAKRASARCLLRADVLRRSPARGSGQPQYRLREPAPPAQEDGWGELHLRNATPDTGREWTDDGSPREMRQLKHRADGDRRIVPVHPELAQLLGDHLAQFGTSPDGGRLFSGVRGGELATVTYRRAWIRARQDALTAAEQASPLARRPYDLRHACLSTWLNGGVYPTQVAECGPGTAWM